MIRYAAWEIEYDHLYRLGLPVPYADGGRIPMLDVPQYSWRSPEIAVSWFVVGGGAVLTSGYPRLRDTNCISRPVNTLGVGVPQSGQRKDVREGNSFGSSQAGQ
jgi:hypothetical protein